MKRPSISKGAHEVIWGLCNMVLGKKRRGKRINNSSYISKGVCSVSFCRRIDELIIIGQWNALLCWLARLEKAHRKSKKPTTPEISLGRPADSTPPLDHWYYPFQICPEWAERNEEIFEVLKIRTSDPAGFDDEFFNFDSSNGEEIGRAHV